MRKLNSLGLVSVVLAAAACASPTTSSDDSQKVEATRAAQSTPGGSPTLDLGSTDPTQVVTVSVVFKVEQLGELETFVQSTQDPASWNYHQFLSVKQFASDFAPSASAIARVSNYLTSNNITVGATLADNLVLKATGTVGAFTQAFTFQMHDFQSGSSRWHRPVSAPQVPSALSDVMLVVTGFSSQPLFQPKSTRAAYAPAGVLSAAATGNAPGNYTVKDFANFYDVNPLYKEGIDGTGSTIGIATLADFSPADAYAYWAGIGLRVNQNRITQVHVDGGGQLSNDAGSGETSIDVEQSGGIAPGANMVVYDAPNTDGGFIDLFYNAASDNLVDSLSVSWGGPELFYYNTALTGVDLTQEMVAFHQAFLEGAAQGISIFAAAGDSGAYDTAEQQIPGASNPLAVDFPASDPALTAAGGTTTPASFNFASFGLPGPNIVVSQEQVWGWDYIQNYFVANYGPSYEGAFFSTGGGGGVSTFWSAPYYQEGYPGIQRSQPDQVWTYTTTTGTTSTTQTLYTLPAHFAGRNVPDISADADPFTGYVLLCTVCDPSAPSQGGWGGTSFVAPQMNGVTALVRQRVHGRVGFLNPMLYRFAQQWNNAAVTDITAGDNWFYHGVPGYEPGAGLGVLDVKKFADAVACE